MVQPNERPSRASDPHSGGPVLRSLEDRLTFRRAQGILAGLVGCGQSAVAVSLRTTAGELDISVLEVAKRVLSSVATPRDARAEALLLRIAMTALMPDAAAFPRAVGALHVSRSAEGASLTGELDGVTAAVLAQLSPHRPPERLGTSSATGRFCLDLADVTFLSPAGLRALGAFLSRLHDGGIEVDVLPPVASGPLRMLQFAASMGYVSRVFGAASPPAPRPLHEDAADRSDPRHAPRPASADLDDLEALYDSFAAACWSFARRLLDDDGSAEAVVVSTFVEARRQLQAGVAMPERAGTWLLLLTHQKAVRVLREQRAGRARDAGRAVVRAWQGSQDEDALAALPPDQGDGLRLAIWGGLTVRAIAASTGVPLADARASLLAGVRALSGGRTHRRDMWTGRQDGA